MARCRWTEKGGRMGRLIGVNFFGRDWKSMTMPALSLIEVIVASVIFLIVFVASLHTIVSLTTLQNDATVYIAADIAVKETYRKYTIGNIDTIKYKKEYSWGNITTELNAYDEYPWINELTIKVELSSGHREIIYRYLIECKDE